MARYELWRPRERVRILLLGRNGQVGWELQRSLAPVGEIVAPERSGLDLSDPEGLATAIRSLRPDVIVNAAAYTAVDRAETDMDLAVRVNADAPDVLAREAARIDALLVHYSSDYIFSGAGHVPWRESDPAGPINAYGRSKLAGEVAIGEAGCRHVILRTSWVFAARGQNFLRTMLRLAEERDELAVIDDQCGAPTGAELIADVTAHVVRHAAGNAAVEGIYHLAAAGETSWFRYAVHVIESARSAGAPVRVPRESIRPIATSEYRTAARRPLNSRLDTSKLRDRFGLTLPGWQVGVERVVHEVLGR